MNAYYVLFFREAGTTPKKEKQIRLHRVINVCKTPMTVTHGRFKENYVTNGDHYIEDLA